MKHRSISQRLDKAKSADAKRSTLADWSKAWESETMGLIGNLEQAVRKMDYDQLCINTGQLKAVSEKHFKALPSVLTRLIKDDEPDAPCPATEPVLPIEKLPEQIGSIPMPEGYITAREWAEKNGKSVKRGQKILTDWPTLIPAAKKVRNPHGGVDIWAVPKDTIWPF